MWGAERIHVVGRTLLSLKAMMLTPHALKAAFTQDVDRSAELSLVLNPRSHVLLQLLISYSVRAREFSARAKQKPTQLATQQHTSDPPPSLPFTAYKSAFPTWITHSGKWQKIKRGSLKANWVSSPECDAASGADQTGTARPPPSRRDAVNPLCAEPGWLYKSGCTSTDRVQQQEDASTKPLLLISPAQTPTCRLQTAESVGDFFCSLGCFWRVLLKTLSDRRSSFARLCPRIWTYAQPLCRTVYPERTWRAPWCSCGRQFCSRKRRSWIKRRRSENWPRSWPGARARAASSLGTRGPGAGGKKRGPKTRWGTCREAPRTLWRNYHRLYSRWSRGWKTWR